MAGPKRFNKDKRPKRPAQNLLFKRKRFCRFTVTGLRPQRITRQHTVNAVVATCAADSRGDRTSDR